MGQSSREFSDSVENNLEYKDACRSKTGAFPDGKQLKDVLPALFVRTLIAFLETGSFSNYEYFAFFFQFWEKNICIFHPWPTKTSGFSRADTP